MTGLAVGYITGAAATKMNASIVPDRIMPVIGAIIFGGCWKTAIVRIGPVAFLVGDFVGAALLVYS